MNTKSIIILSLLTLLSLSLCAQNQKSNASTTSNKRSIAAKLLVELDKTPSTNSNNNGRSNKDRCCDDGIAAPSNYQVLAFGLSTSWYLWEVGVGNSGIPNPIPYIQSLRANWEVGLHKGDGQYLTTKSAYVQNNELLISIDGLSNGSYFIEIPVEGNYYTTGFSVGAGPKPPTNTTIQNKN